MKVTRSLMATGAMAATAALLLGACAGEAETADPTTAPETPAASSTLTVWVDADRAGVLEDIATQFEADRGVAVELVTKDFGTIRDDFITQAPTGNGPDIVVGAHDWLGKFVQNGVVAPLEFGDTAADFQEVAITAMSYEGVTYGLPYAVENIAMIRNTDLVAETPATFDELLAVGEAAGTEYAFLVGLDPVGSDPFHLYPLQASFGAPVFEITADGTYDPTTLALGNEGGEQFAVKLAEWGAEGVLNTNISGDIAREEFLAGKSPFFLTGPWNIPAIQEAGINYAIEAIPTAGGETATPFVGVQGFFVSSRSENTIAATEFLVNYIGSEEVQTALYEVGGRAPALLSAFEAAQADADVAAFGAVGAEGVPMPNVPAMDVVWSDWGSSQVAIINGQGDPVELWRSMVASIQEKVTAG